MNKTLRKIIGAGAFGLNALALAGCANPKILESRDLTGDGITDIMIETEGGFDNGRWLFIGQTNGPYIRAKESKPLQHVKYFETNEGKLYVFDGRFYREIPKGGDSQ
jgi:hypothetical protein